MITIKIGNKLIGEQYPTFVIAEIGLNHGGSLDLAVRMIKEAKKAGADAVKIQSYITEKRVQKNSELFPILKKCELTFESQKKLFDFSKKTGIMLFSTPFDRESAEFLQRMQVPVYKIASFYLTHLSFISYLSQKNIPIIISRGMSTKKEIDNALVVIRKIHNKIILLHCISAYPTQDKDSNLAVISTLKKRYNMPIGFSDHSVGYEIPALSILAGAKIIEKHFTLDKNNNGPDNIVSVNPKELNTMIDKIRKFEIILGSSKVGLISVEKPILRYRKYSYE